MANLSALANAVRSAMCDAAVDSLDAGSGAGKVKIYTTAKAALLVTITLNDPAFGSASNGVATVSTSPSAPSGTAVAGGTAAVAEFLDSDDNVKWEGTVTATGGGGALTIASTTISDGGTVQITGGTITMPAS
jgi:hypothetical protein